MSDVGELYDRLPQSLRVIPISGEECPLGGPFPSASAWEGVRRWMLEVERRLAELEKASHVSTSGGYCSVCHEPLTLHIVKGDRTICPKLGAAL